MYDPSNIVEPAETVITEIENALISAITEANTENHKLKGQDILREIEHQDLSSSDQCSQHIQSLEFAQDLIKRSLDTRIAQAKRLRNALQQVNVLPDEILSMVFQQTLAMSSVFRRHRTLFTLLSVCDRWRRIVDSTPSLWSFVSSSQIPPQMQHNLSKSSRLPLSVGFMTYGRYLTPRIKQSSQQFLKTAQDTQRPWDELTLALPTFGYVKEFIEVPMLSLTKLDLEVRWPRGRTQLALFRGQAPLLEDIRLKNIPVKWNNGVFWGLRRLELDYKGAGRHAPSATQILDIVEGSPNLESLVISSHGRILNSPQPIRPSVEMPYLTNISLTNFGVEEVSALLKAISAPSCNRFTLHCSALQDYSQILTTAETFIRSATKSVGDIHQVSICLGPSSFHYHTLSSSSKLDIKFADGPRPDEPLRWFSVVHQTNTDLTSPVNILFNPRFDFTRGSDLLFAALSRLRYTTRVKVAERVIGPCHLLEWLARPEEGRFPFPRMTHMSLGQGTLVMKDVRSFLLRRYSAFSSSSLAAMQSLVLTGRDWDARHRSPSEVFQDGVPDGCAEPTFDSSRCEDDACGLDKARSSDDETSVEGFRYESYRSDEDIIYSDEDVDTFSSDIDSFT